MKPFDFQKLTGFDWDDGNYEKNWIKHNVKQSEIEEVFFNQPLLFLDDPSHSTIQETRWRIQGQTNEERHLFIVFTIRGTKIRPISARDMSRKERNYYEENT
ncbi:MAG: hypothetical protein A2293_07065 [Elusimicrobia bacterium RIFOXYB2_FULL_49_7]|nr:MAG: hypothetical protein A2293_07065 [Elusimicrobia bacterium RIFOXYB2_FULL_49_7]